MDQAVALLGTDKAFNQCMHMGPEAHVLHFPVAMHTMMNVVVFCEDPGDWPLQGKMAAPAAKAEVDAVFAHWGPAVRGIIRLLPDELNKWAIFDMYDHPASSYARGRACIAGDAAHASSPHHGAGAGFGVEDALALSTLLEEAARQLATGLARNRVLSAALCTYSRVRMERSQWLVQSSRAVCDLYEWAGADVADDWDECRKEIEPRAHKIWYFDIEAMLREAKQDYEQLLGLNKQPETRRSHRVDSEL